MQSIITSCLPIFLYNRTSCFYLAINFLPSLMYISPETVCSTFIPLMRIYKTFYLCLEQLHFQYPLLSPLHLLSSISLSNLRPVDTTARRKQDKNFQIHYLYPLLIDYQYFAIKKVKKRICGFSLYSERTRFNLFNFYLQENYAYMLSNPFVLM